jgi:hypothetical protein
MIPQKQNNLAVYLAAVSQQLKTSAFELLAVKFSWTRDETTLSPFENKPITAVCPMG